MDIEAKRQALWNAYTAAAQQMHRFPSGPMGLTPDHVKASPEYRQARAAMDRAHNALRTFNGAHKPPKRAPRYS